MDQSNTHGHDPNTDQSSSKYAPWYHVPKLSLVCIDHPFIVENIDNAFDTLGGLPKIRSFIQDGSRGEPASLILRPHDPMCKPITAHKLPTNDIVFKVTVPKRTGLKRRKGASGPYHEGLEGIDDRKVVKGTRYMLRSLRDNVSKYTVEPVGSVKQTHRFRNLPDFVFATTTSPFMTKMRETIMPFQYEKLKNFKMDMSRGPRVNTDLIPPPRWTHLTVPFNYSYLQSSAAKQTVDSSGNIILKNFQVEAKAKNQPVPYDVTNIPMRASEELPPVACLEPPLRRLIEEAQRLFEERPIWTKRALRNQLNEADWKLVGENSAKYIWQYVGYLWASGPWRDALAKFGVDPRKDPSCRHYQTVMFILNSQPSHDRNLPTFKKKNARDTHIFDGRSIALDGKLYQICDITDPFIVSILSTSPVRDKCHVYGDGWFPNGTYSKLRTIMRLKLLSLMSGQIPSNSLFERAARLIPNVVNDSNKHSCVLGRKILASKEERALFSSIRTNAWKSVLDERKVLDGLGRGPQGVQRRGNGKVDLEDESGNEQEEGDMGPEEDEDEDQVGDEDEDQNEDDEDEDEDGDEDEDEDEDENEDEDEDEDEDGDGDEDQDGDGDEAEIMDNGGEDGVQQEILLNGGP